VGDAKGGSEEGSYTFLSDMKKPTLESEYGEYPDFYTWFFISSFPCDSLSLSLTPQRFSPKENFIPLFEEFKFIF